MAALAPDLPTVEQRIVEMTNKVRAEHKLEAVKVNAILTKAARSYADKLARSGLFSHTADGRQPGERAESAGYRYCAIGENLAMNQDSRGFRAEDLASQAMNGWINSPGHRANILMTNATEIGAGVAKAPGAKGKYISVQLFGRPSSASLAFQISNTAKSEVQYSFAGKTHDLKPHTSVVHESCSPGDIVFSASGGGLFSGPSEIARVRAQDGKLYTLKTGTNGIRMDVTARENVR
ncbi:CAP domain-containing protein [Hyphomicrobium methylovorum]|uniref:CAP domain-containing protein n=1 Tax=Hyphomicrobium methylovorum TaxID=84 RepID=UPI0015E66522|nr:CAP domain-containing protein [Hyphomicrobium methylovorum]MBA2124664.1 CAP domain-containing protein [Hyphomicrobium methylovorum]